MAKMSEKEIQELENNRTKLKLLVGDASDEEDMEFKGNKADSRFNNLISNKDFAMDPTHKDFHKVQGGAFVDAKASSG